jgi:hypothetical protein
MFYNNRPKLHKLFPISFRLNRCVYQEASADKSSEKQEKVSPTPKPEESEKKFEQQKKSLQASISLALKSPLQSVRTAALEAQKQLDAMEKGKETDILRIENNLNRIQGILDYTEYHKCTADIKEALKKNAAKVKADFQNEVNDFYKKYPKLTPQQKTQIVAANQTRTKKVLDAYDSEFLPNSVLSLEQFLADRDTSDGLFAQAQELRSVLLQGEVPADFSEIQKEFETTRDALELAQLGLDLQGGISYVTDLVTDLLKQYDTQKKELEADLKESPDDEYYQDELKYLDKQTSNVTFLMTNTIATLSSFRDSKDNEKRSLILAKFADDLSWYKTGGEYEPLYLNSTLKVIGRKRDSIAEQFLNDNIYVDSTMSTKLGVKVPLKMGSDFRMDGSGILLADNSRDGLECSIVDDQVFVVKSWGGVNVYYVRVQISPPNGPIGYVPKDGLNFKATSKEADTQEKPVDHNMSMKAALKTISNTEYVDPLAEAGNNKEVLKYVQDKISRVESSSDGPQVKKNMYGWLIKNLDHADSFKEKIDELGGIDKVPLGLLVEAMADTYLAKNSDMGDDLRYGDITLADVTDTILKEAKTSVN